MKKSFIFNNGKRRRPFIQQYMQIDLYHDVMRIEQRLASNDYSAEQKRNMEDVLGVVNSFIKRRGRYLYVPRKADVAIIDADDGNHLILSLEKAS
jgi:hypothetical protein